MQCAGERSCLGALERVAEVAAPAAACSSTQKAFGVIYVTADTPAGSEVFYKNLNAEITPGSPADRCEVLVWYSLKVFPLLQHVVESVCPV